MTAPPPIRLVHGGQAGVRVHVPGQGPGQGPGQMPGQGPGSSLSFDPAWPPAPEEPCCLTAAEPHRLRGVVHALERDRAVPVVAVDRLLDWLGSRGPVRPLSPPATFQGFQVEAVAYRPASRLSPAAGFPRSWRGVRHPVRTAVRLGAQLRLPRVWPVAVRVVLPGGRTLLHLGGALHRSTPWEWLQQNALRLGNPHLLLVEPVVGQAEALLAGISRFAPRQVVVADLSGDARREQGRPVEPLLPLVDRLRRRGLEACALASHTSVRFERLGGP